MNLKYYIILASQSPRRQQLLTEMGLSFEVRTKYIEETFPPTLAPADVPAFLSQKKAHAFKSQLTENELVITSDTVVIHENKILGKPQNEAQAYDMISSFSGKKHTVISAVTILTKHREMTQSDRTDVYFEILEDTEIQHYIQKFKPFDKAGAYGIQEMIGMIGIHRIDGSYFNVVGLPTHLLWKMLKKFQ